MGKKGKKGAQGDTAKNAADMEEDIDQLLHELDAKEGKRGLCHEEASERPSPRVHATLTQVGPGTFMLFGGEYYDGRKIQVFHDLYKLQLDGKNDNVKIRWSRLSFETGPRARSAHQAVFYKNKLYVHGGEYTSPNLNKFHHFSDLWCLDCAKSPRWSEVVCHGKVPLARSGHRATVVGGKIFTFGGFFDNSKEVKYFNDLNSFDLSSSKWSHFVPSSSSSSSSASSACRWPQARSGCGFSSAGEVLVLVGGFSREGGVGSSGQDDTKGIPFWDVWTVNVGGHVRGGGEWRCEWRMVEMGDVVPRARVAFGLVEVKPFSAWSEEEGGGGSLLLFGGVHDEQVEDSLESKFLNDAWVLRIDGSGGCRWKMLKESRGDDELQGEVWPQGRMSVHVCCDGRQVVIYGGKRDGGEREMTFDDVWTMDVECLKEGERSTSGARMVESLSKSCSIWFESDDEDGEEGEEDEDEDEDEDEEDSQGEECGNGTTSNNGELSSVKPPASASEHQSAPAAKQPLPQDEAAKRKRAQVSDSVLSSICEHCDPLGWRVRKEISSSSSSILGSGWGEVLLQPEQILQFDRQGHIKYPQLLGGEALQRFQRAVEEEISGKMLEEVKHIMRVLGEDSEDDRIKEEALRCEDAEEGLVLLQRWCEEKCIEVPFLQGFNLHWGTSKAAAVIRALSLSEWMGKAAAQLLGVDSVRLYQTSSFFKRPSHGETTWHTDLNTAPLDTNGMVTCWIALSPVLDEDHSPLLFASGSHRDFALPYWYTCKGMQTSSDRRYPRACHAPLLPGDATFHHGWILHGAPPNFSGKTRKAFALTYIAEDAKLLGSKGTRQQPASEDYESYSDWIPSIPERGKVDHPLVPIVCSGISACDKVDRYVSIKDVGF